MNLSSLSVRRGVTFSMLFLLVLGFGLFSLSRLQLDLYPDISFPTVIVITSYSGANPEDVETLVTRPLEAAVASVKGVKEIRSDSKQGASLLTLEFDWGKDMEQAETEVRRAIDMVKGYLPDEISAPMVFAFDPSMQPIVMTMISGPYPLDELRRIADEEIQPRLERLDGIAAAEAAGGLEREIHVTLDPLRIEAFGLNVAQVVGAVYQENRQEPGGYLEQGPLEFDVHTLGQYRKVEDIGDVVVGSRLGETGPRAVRLSEVATVSDSFWEDRRILEVDGKPAIWMMVRKQSGANTVQAANRVMAALPQIARDSGSVLEFRTIFNQADIINSSLGNLSSAALQGVFITFIVLLVFLRNLRSSLIVATAIPLSVVATFAVMDTAGMTLNVLSLAGLALAVGMLVDNAIVVLENIFRLREDGRHAWEAAIEGAGSVGLAVSASTLTTVVVFVPVLFVPGIAGVMFKDMAVTICFSLLVSLVIALSFIPLASSRLLGTVRAEKLLERAKTSRDWFTRVRDAYGRSLDTALRRRWVVILALVSAIGATVVVAGLLPTDFMMQSDDSFIYVGLDAPVGTNLAETHERILECVSAVDEVVRPDERRMVAVDVGIGKGFVTIFAKGTHAGALRIPLVKPEQRKRTKREIQEAIRNRLARVPGITATVSSPFSMTGEGDLELVIRTHDLEKARPLGEGIRKQLLDLPDVGDVTFSLEQQKPQLEVAFDRRKMSELGLSTSAVGSAVATAYMGKVAGRFVDAGDEYDIRVRYGREHRLDADELGRMPIATIGGQTVPLGNIADVRTTLGPVAITRKDQERVTRLNVYLRDQYETSDNGTVRKDLGRSIERIETVLKAVEWPEDVTWTIGGTAEDFQTSFRYLALALIVSMLLVYMVMASQFESFRQPFIIMFTVPLAGIGVVLMFSLTRSTLDVSALIGVIMLVGIVVNNGIILVDCANQLRLDGLERLEAISKAARLRLRPVLLTSMTTIFGMVPMALGIGEGAENWAGMAKAVIGGLVTATFLTLYIVPTMYTVFAPKRLRHEDHLVHRPGSDAAKAAAAPAPADEGA